MMIDEEAVIRPDVDGIEREGIPPVEDHCIGRTIVDAPPVITGGQMRVVELCRGPAACKRDESAGKKEGGPNRPGRFADRPL